MGKIEFLKTMTNHWNKLAKYFRTSNASSADNVEIVEPILIKEIQKIDNVKIIDYGCGSGNFCKRISSFVESILGIDTSTEMIKKAKSITMGRILNIQINLYMILISIILMF
jgi:2-polyprenyl-3-methyl-5-hydroxy-6-metoxy-1,4-benzoquinol methylase